MVVHVWHCVTWLDRASGCMGVVNLYGSFRLSFVSDLCATIQSALVRVATDFEH